MDDEIEYKPWAWLWKYALPAVIILAILGIFMNYVGAFGTVASAPAKIVAKTADADNIIANYEWFRQQYRDIQSFGSRVELAKGARDGFMTDAGPRAGWSAEDKYRYAQLNDNLTGLQAQRARMIETYNARSQMANRSLFRGADVPAFIEQPAPIQ